MPTGARVPLAGDIPHLLGRSKGRERNPGSALEPGEQALRLPRLVPRQSGSEPHSLRKAKLPKQINQSVKISLGERLSQLAQPRSSKGNCSRSPRRKQQIVLRSSSPAALLPSPPPPSLGCREHLCLGISQGQHRLSFWLPGQCPASSHCCGRRAQSHCLAPVLVLPGDLLWSPVCLVALGTRRVTRLEVGLASKRPSGQSPYLSWRFGSDGDQRG